MDLIANRLFLTFLLQEVHEEVLQEYKKVKQVSSD